MKRDMELIREILLAVQSKEDVGFRPVDVSDYALDVVDRHVEMLIAGGFLVGHRQPTGRSFSNQLVVSDMSWEGHEFISALSQGGVWNQMKSKFSAAELAGLPLSVVKDVGVGLLKEWAKAKVGLGGDA